MPTMSKSAQGMRCENSKGRARVRIAGRKTRASACIGTHPPEFVPLCGLARSARMVTSRDGSLRQQNTAAPSRLERAIFAGGRFWSLQGLLRRFPNVVQTRAGYGGGGTPRPTYRDIGSHAEAVEIHFGPGRPGYRRLLEFFFQIHDPTTRHRQGDDVGSRYRSMVFCTTDYQRSIAMRTIAAIDACRLWPGPVVTEIISASTFWEAEAEHQNYLDRNPGIYRCHFIRSDWLLPTKQSE
jgi:peptide-methionine (S)-S-oxide reductase